MTRKRQRRTETSDQSGASRFLLRLSGNRRFPLHVHIATLFIGLILLVGLSLGWFNYRKNAEIILSASEQLFDQINQETISHLRETHRHTAVSINILVHTPIVHAHGLDERMANLPALVETLVNEPALSALQVGYANGDYFIVRPLRSQDMRQRFDAPEKAFYVVDNIVHGSKGRNAMWRFYLAPDLAELGRKQLPETAYDPRKRDWYQQAMGTDSISIGKPYLYYFIKKVGLTVARRTVNKEAVVAADITLESLSDTIARHPITPSAEVLVMDADGKVLAYRDPRKVVIRKDNDQFEIARVDQLGSPVLTSMSPEIIKSGKDQSLYFEGQKWLATTRRVDKQGDSPMYLTIVVPEQELLSDAMAIARNNTLITVVILLLSLPVVWLFAHQITRSLRTLSGETRQIRKLDFSRSAKVDSMVVEINELANGMDVMKETINRFLALITSLAGETDFDRLLRLIARETLEAGQADAVGVFLLEEEGDSLRPSVWVARQSSVNNPFDEVVDTGEIRDDPFSSALRGKMASLIDIGTNETGELSRRLMSVLGGEPLKVAIFPLNNRKEEVIGVLYVVYGDPRQQADISLENDRLGFVQGLTGFAAISLETRLLLKSQKDLLEAFIELIASAIDAKSPYTGGHCQRVPVLTRMLARAAEQSDAPAFADFKPGEEDWEAIHIAAWLHDCGKVTTPEYVVDKATKLETLYNRIHEIRTRFEVLKRDVWIEYWRQMAEGGEEQELQAWRDMALNSLDEDFAFVAQCNEGGEFMSAQDIQRLKRISRRTWLRTLDDSIGLSREEAQRRQGGPPAGLPVEERLLADKVEHRIPRDAASRIKPDNPWGFKLEVPEYKFNRGELYNLSIQKGTLTEEERYIINDHIVQTIIMLEQLPYPRHLRQVPALAGAHHEKMDGSGYPRKLRKDEMPLVARIMAIADIFEAITASDRPYKKPRTLSQALKIMYLMKKDQHIDAELFDLFLTSGVYLSYAREYLSPEQLDEVDIQQYLS